MAQITPTCAICGGPLGCGVGGNPPIVCLGHAAVPELIEACKALILTLGLDEEADDLPEVKAAKAAIEKAGRR